MAGPAPPTVTSADRLIRPATRAAHSCASPDGTSATTSPSCSPTSAPPPTAACADITSDRRGSPGRPRATRTTCSWSRSRPWLRARAARTATSPRPLTRSETRSVRTRCSASADARSNNRSSAVTTPARSMVRRSGSSSSSTPPITRNPSCSEAALTVTAHMSSARTSRPDPGAAASSTGSCVGAGPVRPSRRPVSSSSTTHTSSSSASAAAIASTSPPGQDDLGEPVVRRGRVLDAGVRAAADSLVQRRRCLGGRPDLHDRHGRQGRQRAEQRDLLAAERPARPVGGEQHADEGSVDDAAAYRRWRPGPRRRPRGRSTWCAGSAGRRVVGGPVGLVGLGDQSAEARAQRQPDLLEGAPTRIRPSPACTCRRGSRRTGQVGDVRAEQGAGPVDDGVEYAARVARRGEFAGDVDQRGQLGLTLLAGVDAGPDPQGEVACHRVLARRPGQLAPGRILGQQPQQALPSGRMMPPRQCVHAVPARAAVLAQTDSPWTVVRSGARFGVRRHRDHRDHRADCDVHRDRVAGVVRLEQRYRDERGQTARDDRGELVADRHTGVADAGAEQLGEEGRLRSVHRAVQHQSDGDGQGGEGEVLRVQQGDEERSPTRRHRPHRSGTPVAGRSGPTAHPTSGSRRSGWPHRSGRRSARRTCPCPGVPWRTSR